MATNPLLKTNFDKNSILKELSLVTRTRVRNASLNKFRWNKDYILGFVDGHLIHDPTPIGLTYAWSFGSLAGISLVIQRKNTSLQLFIVFLTQFYFLFFVFCF